jgi:thiamine pyrophosphate-dependent acetolactate synthase large subunit-like protein
VRDDSGAHSGGNTKMKTGPAIAEILKREGVEYLFAYPVNHLIEHCAALDIRPIIVRQERIGLHMADAMSRLTKGRKMGVFCMQSGPGSENAYGGVAQAFGESVPLLVIPAGYPRRIAHVPPNFNSTLTMAHVAKHAEPITSGAEIENIMRRAFSLLRNGRGSPVIIEFPAEANTEDAPEPSASGCVSSKLLLPCSEVQTGMASSSASSFSSS